MNTQTKTMLTLGLGLLWSTVSVAQTIKNPGAPTSAQQPKTGTTVAKPTTGTTGTTSGSTVKPNTSKPATTTTAAKPLAVGQEHLGGIIVKLNTDGKSGLIVAGQDLPQQMTWADAKKAVDDMVVKGPNYDFTDWRLPTKDELQACNDNLFSQNLGGFLQTAYWTSTNHVTPESAICFVFSRGNSGARPYARTSKINVRPVRTF
ncbi:MAG: DUF1566 domain-containing protein [Bacteroidota bacterium]|jgi:hypothetical protein